MHNSNSNSGCMIKQDEGKFLVAIATLVIEGRIPGPSPIGNSKTKDFHEGPHCKLLTGIEETHQCDIYKNNLCGDFERNRDIIQKLSRKRSTFCIEVLFNRDCTILNGSNPENLDHFIVLEQWHFSSNPNRGTSVNYFNVNQLLGAIRSQLYFSQITAWLVTRDKYFNISAKNFRYRLCDPDELLAPIAFSLTASKHEFPTTELENGRILNVFCLSAPRTSSKPDIRFGIEQQHKQLEHTGQELDKTTLFDDRMFISCKVKGKHCCDDIETDNDPVVVTKSQLFLRNIKKPKSSHCDTSELRSHFNSKINDNKESEHRNCKNDALNKGQLLLDAIERSGRINKLSGLDYFHCDKSDSDNLFNLKEIYKCDSLSDLRRTNELKNGCTKSKYIKSRRKITFCGCDSDSCTTQDFGGKFRRNLGNSTPTVFDDRTGLPLSSSPAPIRKGQSRFDFDASINSVSAIKCALFSNSFSTDDDSESEGIPSPCSPESFYASLKRESSIVYRCQGRPGNLLGTFEESVLNGRLEPVSTVHGFTAELGASGSFVPKHIFVPVVTFFYAFGDHDKVSSPYLGQLRLGKKGYNVPKTGSVQVTLFNPLGTVVKMFVLPYDLSDMPPNSQTFIRQRTFYMPSDYKSDNYKPPNWLRFLIHVRFMSSKSGKIYLHSDIQMIIIRKSDMDTATAHDIDMNYELRSFVQAPTNPKFSPRK
ncbi:hypothetical protein ABEB36_007941 [Hypothenemus hampei]|uniref:Atos-like conserved domain-containing protein n=1 Tax=Hypothenemus hampei TaxID=57062 RepID=A0ABD1EVP0_HYPHA